jgi:hypothetical protein
MTGENKFIKALYDQLNPKLDLGDYPQFETKLDTDDKFRKAIYDEGMKDLDLGDFSSFEGNVKKKVSPLESASKGQTILQDFGQPLNESTTQVLPSTSVEIPPILTSTPPQTQPSDATKVNIVERPFIPQPIETKFEQGRGIKPENLGEAINAFGGTLNRAAETIPKLLDWVQMLASDATIQAISGLKTANEVKQLRENQEIDVTHQIRPFEMVSNALEEWTKKTTGNLVLPQGKEKGGVLGDIATGTAQVLPDIATAYMIGLAMPEMLALEALEAKTGIKLSSTFGLEQGAKTAMAKAQQYENDNNIKKVLAPLVGTIEGYVRGYMFDNVGLGGNQIGKAIADKVIPKVTTQTDLINKAIIQTGGATLSTAGIFGGWGVLDEFRRTGQISSDTFLSNAGVGIALGAREPARMLFAKGLSAFIGTPKELINNVINSDIPAEDHAKEANDKFDAVANGTSVDTESDLASGKIAMNTAILKSTADQVINNKNGLILAVKSSTFDSKVKKAIIDKINAVDADNDPKIQATKDITDKISMIDDKLDDIRTNESWDDARKEVESAPLKERKQELKEEAMSLYGVKPKEKEGVEKEKPKVQQTELSKKTLEEINKPKIEEETKNAESSQRAQELEQGTQTGVHLRDNEETRLEAGTGEEVKQDNFMSDSKNAPEGVKEQIKEYKKPGELQKGWEEVIQTIPKKPIGTLTDGRKVFVVSGTEMRDKVYTNFTEGGNDSAYPWMPKGELWIEDVESNKDKIADLIHEAGEQKAMQETGMSYDKAHEIGLADERKYRETGEIPDDLKEIAALLEKEPVEPLINTPPNKTVEPTEPPSDVNVPPPPDSGTEQPPIGENEEETGGGGTGRSDTNISDNNDDNIDDVNERKLLLRYRNAKNISPEFKELLDKTVNYTYRSIPNTITESDVDYIISKRGLEEVEKVVKNIKSDIPARIRMLAGVRVTEMFGELAKEAEKNGDDRLALKYRMRKVDMAEFLSDEAMDMGRGLQILASQRVLAALDPTDHVIKVKRLTRGQRDYMIDKNSKDINKKNKNLKEEQEKTIDEVINSKEFQALKARVKELEDKLKENGTPIKPKVRNPELESKIYKERAFRDQKWDELKDLLKKRKEFNKSGSMGLTADPYTEAIVGVAGELFRSYIKEGIYRTEDLIIRFKKDWFKKTGELIDDDEIRGMLPKDIEGKSLQQVEEEGIAKDASDRLADRIDKMLKDPKTPEDDPVKQMIDTLFEKVKEKNTKEKVPTEKKSVIDKIKEAIENKKEYADTWEDAKEKVAFKISNDDSLSESQKSDRLKQLSSFFDEVIGKPFSETQTARATKEAMKDLNVDIDKVVRDHYTVYDATKKSLQDKLIDELGLSGDDAKMFSDAVSKQFDKLAIVRKQAILKKGITPKEIVRNKVAKEVWQKLIEDTNLGAWSDSEFTEAYADKWGFPKLTDEQAGEIERLADKVYKAPEGFPKYEAVQDLLKYQIGLPGIDKGQLGTSLWYNFILSGVRTQWKNILQNNLNSFGEYVVASTRGLLSGNPFAYQFLREGYGKGLNRGRYEAGHILKKGYNPIKGGKVEAPTTTELSPKGSIGWASKYVTRWMVAADMVSYAGLKEMRSYELAMNMARAERKQNPTIDIWKRANEVLNNTRGRLEEAQVQADQEGFKSNEKKRRVWEIIEQGRPKEMIEDAVNFAARGTFNHAPEGVLGLFTDLINTGIQKTEVKMRNPFTDKTISIMPIKLLIPFTRIIANVANTGLDYYPPVGFIRAASGQMGLKSMGAKYREYTPEERQKLIIKATIGLGAQVLLYALTHHKDKDDKSYFEITASGSGDYKKNNEMKERGWQPYSIRIGDRWWSYQYTPMVLALAPIGFMRDFEQYQPDKAKGKSFLNMYARANITNLKTFNDMTWATSLNSFMNAFATGDPGKVDSYFTNFAVSTAKGFIYPKIAEQTVQLIDAMTDNPRHEAQGIVGKIMRDLPIVRGKYGMNYKSMLNPVGDPVKYDLVQMAGKVKHDPFWDYCDEHKIFIGKPDVKTLIYDDINKVERAMNDDEYYEYILKTGQEIKKRITEELMSQKLSDDDIQRDKQKIINDVHGKFKTELFGWGQLRHDHPDDWKFFRDNDALQIPHSSVQLKIGNKSERFGSDNGVPTSELEDFNKHAMGNYRVLMLKYFQDMEQVAKDKATPTVLIENGEEHVTSAFNIKTRTMWSNASQMAKKQVEEIQKTLPTEK